MKTNKTNRHIPVNSACGKTRK